MKASSHTENSSLRLHFCLLALATAMITLTFSGGVSRAAGCPNEALREAQGATALPDCMALEMVSPIKKFGQPAYSPSFSASGERVLFNAQAALAETPGFQSFDGDRYVASRTASGWQVSALSPPLGEIVAGGRFRGGPLAFTPQLDRWVQLGATKSQLLAGVAQLFSGGLAATYTPLSPLLVPIDNSGTAEPQFAVNAIEVSGASDDLSTAVIQPRTATFSYLPGDPSGTDPLEPGSDRNSYVAFVDAEEPKLELLARASDGTVYGGLCRAHLGGPLAVGTAAPTFNQGAISDDGARIYLSTRPAQPFDSLTGEGPTCDTDNPLRILVRRATIAGPQITPLLSGGQAEWEQPGDDLYEGASADGSKVYFTSTRALASSDADSTTSKCGPHLTLDLGCDLYLYDFAKPESERLTHVSADPNPGEQAHVLRAITAISRDGSRAYFVARGALTGDPNPEGAVATAGGLNLYAYDASADDIAFVGGLDAGDAGGLWGMEGSFFGDAYAASDSLVFASKAKLTADDEDGGRRDVYRYKAEQETLERVSKAAPGGSDDGPFDVTVNPNGAKLQESNFGEQGRWVSEDGQSIAFRTAENLLAGDEDEAADPYVWRSGELGAVSASIKFPPAVSPEGSEVAFSTPAALLPQDGDTAEDVYVARTDGGFPFPVEPTACDPLQEGSCQAKAAASQPPTSPASASFSGPGNAKEPNRCRKPLVKRRGRCVRKASKAKARKHAGKRQGGKR